MKRSKGKLVKTLVKHAMVKCACAISNSQKKPAFLYNYAMVHNELRYCSVQRQRETPEIAENHSLNFTWDISVSHNERRMHNYM